MSDSSKGIKIILLGESGVGKTNLINVATGEEFEQNSMSSSSGSYKEGVYISSDKKNMIIIYGIRLGKKHIVPSIKYS